MSNYNSLKTTIDANIKQNGRQEITGQILNSVLNQMVTTLGTGYQFMGVATIDTNPGSPDAKVFYIANGKGTYTNFGGIEVTEDEVVALYYDTEWHKEATGIASNEKLTELESEILKKIISPNNINKRINENGVAEANEGTFITDFIPVDLFQNDVIEWLFGNKYTTDEFYLCVYDSNKQKINSYSCAVNAVSRQITYPFTSGYYIRATFALDTFESKVTNTTQGVVYFDINSIVSDINSKSDENATNLLKSVYVNPDFINKKLNSDGTLTANLGSFVTDFIPVSLNGNTIIWKYGILSGGSLLIYDIDKNIINDYSVDISHRERSLTLYEVPIAYIRTTFQIGNENAKIIDANSGVVYYDFYEQTRVFCNDLQKENQHKEKELTAVSNSAFTKNLVDVASGGKEIIKDFLQLQQIFSKQSGYDSFFEWNGVLKYTIPTNVNKWWGQTFSLTPPSGAYIYIKIRYRFTQIQAQSTLLRFSICNNPDPKVGSPYPTIDAIRGLDTDIHEKLITIDPAYWQMYQGIGNTFYLWLLFNEDYASGVEAVEIYDLQMFYVKEKFEGQRINGSNAKELFESVDNALTEINVGEMGVTLIRPDMKKYALQLDNDGILKAIPFIPNKVKWTGNSLAANIASETGQGWRYYIAQALTSMGTTSIGYVSNANIEEATTEAMVDAAVATIVGGLEGDEDMVVIQLGDNTSPADRQAVFAYEVVKLLSEIRKKCPAARVFWMGCWYPTNEIMQKIKDGVKKTGAYLCDISGMNNSENDNHIGGIYHSAGAEWATNPIQQTLDNVSNVDEVSTNHLVVTFTINDVQYVSDEIEVNSWSLDGTTLIYTSVWGIIKSTGVASHPSDIGMKKIANKFLKDAGLFEGDYYGLS